MLRHFVRRSLLEREGAPPAPARYAYLLKRAGVEVRSIDADALVELASHAGVALENAQDRQQLLSANRQIAAEAAAGIQLIGESPSMSALRSMRKPAAQSSGPRTGPRTTR